MAKRVTQRTFKTAVSAFEQASDWLGPEHAPAVVALRMMAKELDSGKMVPALMSQFMLTFRSLSKEAPGGEETDPLAQALKDAGAGEG